MSFFVIIRLIPLFAIVHVAFGKQSWEINEGIAKTNPAVFGDMILTPAQMLRYDTADVPQIRGVSLKQTSLNRWPNNEIPYILSPQYTASQRTILTSSLRWFESVSCFRFVERTNQRDYLFVVPLDGCYSYVGRIGGRQTVSLAPDCLADYIIWHEMMHAIGFEHEHQRPDRDSFIRVDYQNVQPGQLVNFDKLHPKLVDFPDAYDLKSIMHYDGFAFGKIDTTRRVRLATMVPLQRGVTLADNQKFTATDLRKLSRLGNCGRAGGNVARSTNGTMTVECRDTANNCARNRRRGMCQNERFRSTMIQNCQKTCNFCNLNRSTDTENTQEPVIECEDTHPKCVEFAENGFCENPFYDQFKSQICPKTCKLC